MEDPQIESKEINFQEEMEDPEFVIEDSSPPNEKPPNFIIPLSLKDTLIIVFLTSENTLNDSLCEVTEINYEDEIIQLENENKEIVQLSYTRENEIIQQTESYQIMDLFFVEVFSVDDLDTPSLMLTKELYSDIELLVTEIESNKTYSLYEQKQSIVTELISLMKAHGDETKIHTIYDIIDSFQEIIMEKKDMYSDHRDIFHFVKDIIHRKVFHFPKWFIPISSMKKRLFITEEDDPTEYPDTFHMNFEDYLNSYELSTDIDKVPNYKQLLQNIHSYKPYEGTLQSHTISYSGNHIRDCNEKSPCNGLKGVYYKDILNTKQEMSIPVTEKYETTMEVVSQKDRINVSGFYLVPLSHFSFTFVRNSFSMYETHLFGKLKSSTTLFSKMFSDNQIIPTMIGKDTINPNKLQKQKIHKYSLSQIESPKDLGDILQKNLPLSNELIFTNPASIVKQIYSCRDFSLLLSNYQLSIHDLSPEKRNKMKRIIEINIKKHLKEYRRKIQQKVTQTLKQKVNVLSEEEKIQLSKQFINSLSIIPLRNQYINKIIQRFSRKAKIGENQNFMYEKYGTKQLFCNHYLYSCECHKDPEMFHTMKSLFGTPPKDGIISCQVCGEYLCHEEFSSFQGYDDGATTLEVAKEIDTLDILTQEQQNIMTMIRKIGSFLSIELNIYDTKKITNFVQSISHQELYNQRYKILDAFKQHPQYQEILKQYPIIQKPSSREEKKQNTKHKQKRLQLLKELKTYQEDCNHFLLITFLSLFYLQTSIPPYISSIKQTMNLINSFTPEQTFASIIQSPNEIISINTIDRLYLQVVQYVQSSKTDTFWTNISLFISESDRYSEIPSFKEQFSNLFSHILKNESFKQSFKLYFEYEQTSIRNVYLKESWPSYKPQKDNTRVIAINEKIQEEMNQKEFVDSLLKQKGMIAYENISSIIPIQLSEKQPRYLTLQIPYSGIMKNESYQRLFQYSIHLHGTTKGSMYPINLHLNHFLETTEYSEEIRKIVESYGWNSETKQMKPMNYSDFKTMILIDIINVFKDKEPSNQNTLQTFLHIGFNNWNGMLLNGNPKRVYSYEEPIIFPTSQLDSITKEKPHMIESLYQKFCFDEDGDIQYRVPTDDFISYMIPETLFERNSMSDQSIPVNQETFEKILDFKRQSSKHLLPSFQTIEISNLLNDRINHYVETNQLLQPDPEDIHLVYQKLVNISQLPIEQQENEWNIITSSFLSLNDTMKEKIQEFFINNKKDLREDQIQRYNSLFGRSFESLQIILSKLLEKDRLTHNSIHKIFCIISRLKNHRIKQGTRFHPHTPEQWKLSETNETYLKEFFSINEFLLHNDIFLKQKGSMGFNYYQQDDSLKSCFQGLYQYLESHKLQDLESLIGSDRYLLTEDYSQIIQEHSFLFIYSLLLKYIDNYKEKQITNLSDGNELYSSLEQQEKLSQNKCIETLTQFSFDILIHIIEEYVDPNWIYQNTSSISNKIGKQKEREKQTIIEGLESKTDEHRLVSGFLQNFGIIEGAYKGSEKGNLEYIESQTYEQQAQKDTIQAITTLFEEEEGYSQNDQDRDDEGLDDNDDDGDYHEN